MASPDPNAISTGPGTIWSAPIGTTEPAGRVDAWPSGWVKVGYTAEGHQKTIETSVEEVEVAESLEPIKRITTRRDVRVAFAMAEITLAKLKLALNGGTISIIGATTDSKYEPPAIGAETRTMLGWDSEDESERIIWRKAFQIGNSEIARRKGADFARFSCEFALETPASGAVFTWMANQART